MILRAFTLFELLTCIALIALLFALLMPVIALVRDSARLTVCASNLGQITSGNLAYAHDWRGHLMPMFNTSNHFSPPYCYWPTAIHANRLRLLEQDFGIHLKHYFCPSVKDKNMSLLYHPNSDWNHEGGFYQTHYAYVANPSVGQGASSWANFPAVPKRVVDGNAQTIIVSDIVFTPATSYMPVGNFAANHLRNRLGDINFWQNYCLNREEFRGANQGFLDGHVAFKTGTQFPTPFEPRDVIGFNAIVTHSPNSGPYNWAFYF